MKKPPFLFFFCIIFLNILLVYGQNTASPPARFVTYRVGVGIAGEYASINGHLKNRHLNPVDDGNFANKNFASDTHHTCHKFQISPGFELGAFIAQQYYLGLVGNKHFTNATRTMNTPIGSAVYFEHQLKLKSYTNLLLKFGYKVISKVMFYGLLGSSFANWSHNSKTIYQIPETSHKEIYALSEMNKKTTGFAVGCGIEYLKNNKYAVSMEYTLNMHKAAHLRYQSGYNNPVPTFGSIIVYDATPADVQKSVRLTYSTIGLRFSYFFSF